MRSPPLNNRTIGQLDERMLIRIAGILKPHLPEAKKLFALKKKETHSDYGAWLELIYCILAGTQVPIETARRAHQALIVTFGPEGLQPSNLLTSRRKTRPVDEIADTLRGSGYRYHRTKAAVIVSAAEFISKKINGTLVQFVANGEVESLEKLMTSEIKGVGTKIARHWLRNMGKDTCTIDVHLRRFFSSIGVYRDNLKRDIPRSDFLQLEGLIGQVAKYLRRSKPEVQYALWISIRGSRISPQINLELV